MEEFKLLGSKLPFSIECPTDIAFITLSDKICPYLKKIGMIPNHITLVSLITGIISAYFLYKGNSVAAAGFYVFSYLLDCVDGHYARKYNMETKFGDYFDHVSDAVKNILIFSILLKKTKPVYRKYYIFVIALMAVLMMSHIGCQELITDNNSSKSLAWSKNMCVEGSHMYLRWFGSGTFTMIVCVLMFLHNRI